MQLVSVDLGMLLEVLPGSTDVKTEQSLHLRLKERMIISKKEPIIVFPVGYVYFFFFFGVPA